MNWDMGHGNSCHKGLSSIKRNKESIMNWDMGHGNSDHKDLSPKKKNKESIMNLDIGTLTIRAWAQKKRRKSLL